MRRVVLLLLIIAIPLVQAELTFAPNEYEDGLLYKSMAFDLTPNFVSSNNYSIEAKDASGQTVGLPKGVTVKICGVEKDETVNCAPYSDKYEFKTGVKTRLLYEWKGVALTESFKRIDLIPSFEGQKYAEYAWWNATYNNETNMSVSTAAGTTRQGYQVNITLQDNGYMDSGISIRFANENRTVELPFWVDYSNSVNGSYYSVWVKIDGNITTTGYSFYLYTGNTTPVGWASNGEGVFEVFDDFDGNALNATKWTYAENNGDASYAVADGILTLEPKASTSNYNLIYANGLTLTNGYIIENKAKISAYSSASYYAFGLTDDDGTVCVADSFALRGKTGYAAFNQAAGTATGNRIYEADAACSAQNLVSNMNYGVEAWLEDYRVYGFGYAPDYDLDFIINSSVEGTINDITYASNDKTAFISMAEYLSGAGGTSLLIDWARVRQYHSSAVTATMGTSTNASYNTTWVIATDELPVNATIFSNGSTIGLQGYCSTNGTLNGAWAHLWYYPNNTFVQSIANTSDLTNATSYNWSFTAPAQSLNYSWVIECNATASGAADSSAVNSSGRYFLTNLPAPSPSPSPTPSPTASATATVSDGGTYAGDYQLTYNVRRVCLPFKVCVPFTELCLTLWSVCENEGIDFIAN